jgi:hypothetical protein
MNHHEIPSELTSIPGQRRIDTSTAREWHIEQYVTRSMLEADARNQAVRSIEKSLGIPESKMRHNPDEINMTFLLIRENREDLAKSIWNHPDEFKEKNPAIWGIGLHRISVELKHREQTEQGKEIIEKWSHALGELKQSDI